jgi:zinc and cadmium transporter
MQLLLGLLSTFVVSLISLIGILTFLNEGLLSRMLFYMVGFSAGALIGGAFLHILPEVLEQIGSVAAFYGVIFGIVVFFVLEKYLHWRHCHKGVTCPTHSFTYLNLIGGGFHNFLDGMIIATSYTVSIKIGFVTTVAVILHEIPHEFGDFCVLVYGGFTKRKALLFNFLSACLAMLGALAGFLLAGHVRHFSSLILPLTAGGFIYVAASDLIPELHKENSTKKSSLAVLAFIAGIAFMAVSKQLLHD